MEITNLTPQLLRTAADLQEQIQSLQNRLSQILGGGETPAKVAMGRPRRKISAAGRARIAAAARARWARTRGSSAAAAAKPKRRLSAQGIANIRAGVRKRMAARRGKAAAAATQPRKRKMTAAGRARLAALARARWARVKAAGKNAL